MAGKEVSPGVILAGERALPQDLEVQGPVWIGHDVQIGAGVRLMGPVVLGDGARVGERAQLRESIVFPGTEVAEESILIGAIAGHAGILQSLRPRRLRARRARRSAGPPVVYQTGLAQLRRAVL